MKLPGGADAIVDVAKLRDYCLNPTHPRGRHKARVFAAVLGLGPADADWLRKELLSAASLGVAVEGEADEYGVRYTLDFDLARGQRRAKVRSRVDCPPKRAVSEADELFCTIKLRPVMPEIELLSIVALLEDLPVKGLRRGQVGTIVEALGPRVYEVEFSDDSGQTYASVALPAEQLIQLHHDPGHQAA